MTRPIQMIQARFHEWTRPQVTYSIKPSSIQSAWIKSLLYTFTNDPHYLPSATDLTKSAQACQEKAKNLRSKVIEIQLNEEPSLSKRVLYRLSHASFLLPSTTSLSPLAEKQIALHEIEIKALNKITQELKNEATATEKKIKEWFHSKNPLLQRSVDKLHSEQKNHVLKTLLIGLMVLGLASAYSIYHLNQPNGPSPEDLKEIMKQANEHFKKHWDESLILSLKQDHGLNDKKIEEALAIGKKHIPENSELTDIIDMLDKITTFMKSPQRVTFEEFLNPSEPFEEPMNPFMPPLEKPFYTNASIRRQGL